MCIFIMPGKNDKTGGKNNMKKKETLEKKVLNVVEKIAQKEITENLYSWPPHCMGIYHQPKRPKRK